MWQIFRRRAPWLWRLLLRDSLAAPWFRANAAGAAICPRPRQWPLEGFLVGFGGLVEAGDLSHELQRGRANFVFRYRRIEIEKRFDIRHIVWNLWLV